MKIAKRRKIAVWLQKNIQPLYDKYSNKKKEKWQISKQYLLNLPTESLGKKLGLFLHTNNYKMIPYHETHDIFHVLFNVGTSSEQEGILQFILLGNGKITLYSFGTAMMSIILFPEYIKTYLKAFRIGKRCRAFHHLPYQKLLETHFQTIVKAIRIPISIHHHNTFWNHKTL